MKTSHEKVWDFHHVHDLCTSKNWFCLNRSDLLTSKNLLLMLHMYQKKNVSIFTSTLTILKVTANFKYDMFMTFWHNLNFIPVWKFYFCQKSQVELTAAVNLLRPRVPRVLRGISRVLDLRTGCHFSIMLLKKKNQSYKAIMGHYDLLLLAYFAEGESNLEGI